MPLEKRLMADVKKLIPDARFIFAGVIVQEGASGLSSVPASATTAIVRVERIHLAATDLQNQLGQQVTVLDTATRGAENDGPRRVFFTNPILFGETVGVRQIAQLSEPRDLDSLEKWMAQLSEDANTQSLREHLASADAVVHGRVKSSHRVSQTTAETASEHDPDWWAAEVEVIKALKGEHKKNVQIRFPKSQDIRWYRVPKPHDGQVAIFILHRDRLKVGNATLAMIHADDLLPGGIADVRRIAKLI